MRTLVVLFATFAISSVAMGDWVTDFSTFEAPAYYLEANADDCAVWVPSQQCFRLTSGAQERYGIIIQRAESATANQEIQHLFAEFSAEFAFRIDGAADGIIFVWSDEPMVSKVDIGGYLGWREGRGYGVEVDCWHNSFANDPSGTHIALMRDGPTNHLAYADVPSIHDGTWHTVGVYKSGNFISVHYDDAELFNYTLAENDVVSGQFRFSAATGGFSAVQDVDNIQIVCAGPIVVTKSITWGGIKVLFR